MRMFVGLDVANGVHWACAIDRNATLALGHAVANDPGQIAALTDEIGALEADEVTVALDLLGGTPRWCARWSLKPDFAWCIRRGFR